MQTMNWTDDRVEQLKNLWEQGLSASTIAAEMGGVSRNAVIGKVHRLGLAGRVKPVMDTKVKTKKEINIEEAKQRQETEKATEEIIKQFPDNVIPMAQRVNLLGLRDSTCRYPVGDPTSKDFYFCGGRADLGIPYCAVHAKLTYQAVSEKKRELKRIGGR